MPVNDIIDAVVHSLNLKCTVSKHQTAFEIWKLKLELICNTKTIEHIFRCVLTISSVIINFRTMMLFLYHELNSAGHFCKLQTQGFGLQICEPISYRKHLRICGKKLKSTANQQHRWDRFFAIQKKKFLRFNEWTDLGGCICKVQHSLTEFLCCGTITFL